MVELSTEEKHTRGRPRKYSTPEKMQLTIDEYFEKNPAPTICGLALALGFAQRKSLLNYEGYGKEFCNTIKRAKLRVEDSYEKELRGNNVTGSIFALKNFDWEDKKTVKQEGAITLDISPKLMALGKQMAEKYAQEAK